MSNTPTSLPVARSARDLYWFDPACAQADPSKPDSLWLCSVRSPFGGVICWAEGETPEETRDRCKTICAALNASAVATVTPNPINPALLAALVRMEELATKELWNTLMLKREFGEGLRAARVAIAQAKAAT